MSTAVLLAMTSMANPGHAQAVQPVNDEDRAQFESFYGEKLRQVRLTRTEKDDRDLANEMIELAGKIPDSPGVRCLIYIEAIPLAANGGDLDSAVFASRQLVALWPDHEAADPDAMLELAARIYQDTPHDDRPAIAEAYLELLLSAAARAEEEEDFGQAIALCRQANTIARKVDSKKRSRIEAALERVSSANAVVNEIRLLEEAVKKNPRNARAAEDLVDLLVVRRNDPVSAEAYAKLTGDADLAEVVAMCAKGVEKAKAHEALRVGDWYLALADRQDDAVAEVLLRNAVGWYARFQEVYPREDALSNRVAAMRNVAEARVDRIDEARRAAMRGKWIDLIETTFEPRLHAIDNKARISRGEIKLDNGEFVLPVAPRGNYELRVRFTMHEKTPGLGIHLPAGKTAAMFYYAIDDNSLSIIYELDKSDKNAERMNKPGRVTELIFQVAVRDNDRLGLAMLVDGQESLRWEGKASDVLPNEEDTPPAHLGRVLGLGCSGKVTFHSIEMRERDE